MKFPEQFPGNQLKKVALADKAAGEWAFQLFETHSLADAREAIKARLGIDFKHNSGYCRWRQWWKRRVALDTFDDHREESARDWANKASDPNVREFLLKLLQGVGIKVMEEDPKLSLKILQAAQDEARIRCEEDRNQIAKEALALRRKKSAIKDDSPTEPSARVRELLDGA